MLAADSEGELNSWVTAILRLKADPAITGTGGAMSRAKAQAALAQWLRNGPRRVNDAT